MTETRYDKTRRQLEEALALWGDLVLLQDLPGLCREHNFQCWGDENGLIVTAVQDFPRGRALHYYAGAGDVRYLTKLNPTIEKFARENGVSAMYAMGRPAWAHVVKRFDLGWKPYAMCFVKRLEPAMRN